MKKNNCKAVFITVLKFSKTAINDRKMLQNNALCNRQLLIPAINTQQIAARQLTETNGTLWHNYRSLSADVQLRGIDSNLVWFYTCVGGI